MYKLLEKQIKGVWYNPVLSAQYLFANNVDKTVSVYRLAGLEEVRSLGAGIGFIKVYSNYLFTQMQGELNTDRGVTIFDIDNFESFFEINVMKVLPSEVDGRYLYANANNKKDVVKYDYLSRREIWNSPGQIGRVIYLVNQGILFNQKAMDSNKVYFLSAETGELLWEIDVSDIGEHLHNDEVWKGYLSNDPIKITEKTVTLLLANELMLGIDISSGAILWEKVGVPYIRPYGEILYGLDARHYTVIDPNKGEIIKQIDLTEECKKAGILTGSSFTVGAEYIYFNGSVFGSKTGILEKATGKIVWTCELPTRYGTQVPISNVPIIDENRMYILDAEGTIHIFEKE